MLTGTNPGAPGLSRAVVGDVMHPGVVSCPPETDLVTVARMMATNRIHAIVVGGIERPAANGGRLAWGLISDLDLVGASLASPAGEGEAGDYASSELVTVDMGEPLERAAQLMVEHQLAHLLVMGPGALPIGVVSTLDVAGAIARGAS
jgi:CBS domain-containing protein